MYKKFFNLSSFLQSIIELAKELAKDTKALLKLKMYRTTASYKMTHGLTRTLRNELVNKPRVTHLSKNLDEATFISRLLSSSVSYFNTDSQTMKVEQLASLSVSSVHSASLYA